MTEMSAIETKIRGYAYSALQVAEIVGITYRQLDYWTRCEYVTPTITMATGSGSRRKFSFADMLGIYALARLVAEGVKQEVARDIVPTIVRGALPEIGVAVIGPNRYSDWYDENDPLPRPIITLQMDVISWDLLQEAEAWHERQ